MEHPQEVDDEGEPLRSNSQDASALKDWAIAQHLSHKLSLLEKASILHEHDLSFSDAPDLTTSELSAVHREVSHKWQQPKLLYFVIAVCSLGAVLQGWAQTSMNGANLSFPDDLGVGSDSAHDVVVVGFINCAIYLSVGFWGAWLSEPLNRRYGRRGAVFGGSVLCLLASLGSAVSGSWFTLALFRLLLGTGLGINASTVSVYAAECAPSQIRGGLAVSWQMWTAFGIFVGFVVNVAVYDYGPSAWRLQLAGSFLPALLTVCSVYACPESPVWYVKQGRFDLAYQSWSKLRNAEFLAAREVYASYLQPKIIADESYFTKLAQLFSKRRIRNATAASSVVMLSQQLCGINIIAFYSSTIFSNAGFSTFSALIASCIFGLVNFFGAFPAIWTMDTLGRRSLLLWTLPFMAITMFMAGLTLRLPESNFQFGLLAILIYLFCAEYSPGMGPVPCAYSAEIFPSSHREIGMSLAIATANFWAAVLSLTFPGLLAGIGSEGAFELYAMLNVLAFVLVFCFVRETKAKTLDELDTVFSGGMANFVKVEFEQYMSWWRSKAKDGSGYQEYTELRQDEAGDLE
jgi:sugar porter (SP) family MFS transporter